MTGKTKVTVKEVAGLAADVVNVASIEKARRDKHADYAQRSFKRLIHNVMGKKLYWNPQPDITAFELALLTPYLFDGMVYIDTARWKEMEEMDLQRHFREVAKVRPSAGAIAAQ